MKLKQWWRVIICLCKPIDYTILRISLTISTDYLEMIILCQCSVHNHNKSITTWLDDDGGGCSCATQKADGKSLYLLLWTQND